MTTQSANRSERGRAWLIAGALGVLALLVNGIDVRLLTAETPNFVFGGSLVLLAFVMLGTGPGLLAAVLSLSANFARLDVIGLVTIIYVIEACVVYRLARRTGSLIAAAALFWLVAGAPLDWLLYGRIAGLPASYIGLLWIKQILNGLFNALLASALLRLRTLDRIAGRLGGRPPASVRRYVFASVGFVVVPPLLILAVLFTRAAYDSRISAIRGETQQSARGAALATAEFTEAHEHAIELLARRIDAATTSGDDVADLVRRHHLEHPEYLNLTLADATGVIVLSDPEATPGGVVVRGRNVAHRPYFRDASRTLQTTYSPVMIGPLNMRTEDGPEPILIVAEPLLDGAGQFRGIVFGAIDVHAIEPILAAHRTTGEQTITLFDESHRVVASTSPELMPATELSAIAPRDSLSGAERSFTYEPPPAHSRESALGLDVRYATYQPLPDGAWGVLVETPAHVVHAGMLPAARQVVAFIVVTFLLLALIVGIVSRSIAEPLLEADRLASSIIDDTVGRDRSLERLASSPVAEARSLADRLAVMQGALAEKAALSRAREQESAERFHVVSHATNDAVREWDLRDGSMWWNVTVQALFGYAEGAVGSAAHWWAERIHPEDRERVLRHFDALCSAGGPDFALEYRFRRADGDHALVLDRGRIVCGAEGAPVRVVAAMADITKLRRSEQERARLEEQLRQVQKMEAVGLLAGGVAHDFNNLLTPILGFAELAGDHLEPGHPVRTDLDEIRKAATLAQDLTRQLLAFGRRQVLELSVFDLNDQIVAFHGMLRRMVREDIRIDLRLDVRPCPVRADRSQVEQALLNLAANAQDAMPNGGTLTIATVVADDLHVRGRAAPRSVILSVSDTGHGMDAETVSHIFEPFFTTKERGKGTGLGLATVHGIVRQHDGTIDVHSSHDRGTTFSITLAHAGTAAVCPPDAPVAERPAGDATILLVEDEAAVRGLVRRVLHGRGFTVLDAASPAEALALAASVDGTIDLLITDVIMPGMNGAEMARRLAAQRPGLRILYMSGYSDTAITRHGVLEPGINFLAKPFTAGRLLACVADVLDRDVAAVA